MRLVMLLLLAGCTGDKDTDDTSAITDTTETADTSATDTSTTGDSGTTDTSTTGDSGTTDTSITDTNATDTSVTDTGITLETCDQIAAAFHAETEDIRSCKEATECGQVLTGTSCGCTQNWIARLDADVTDFYALIDQASAMECELIPDSSCDCPNVYGFACDEGTCAWEYDSPLPTCRAADGDAYTLTKALIVKDELRLTASASGGCAPHDFTICWPSPWFEGAGKLEVTELEIHHDDHNDPCDAIISEDIRYDLAPLREAWKATYQQPSGSFLLRVGEHELTYTF